MDPIRVQQPGSNDVYTISRFDLRTAQNYYDIGKYLASRFARYWPPVVVPGGVQSVDQEFKWRAECASILNNGGVILQANHTAGNGQIIGVAIARTTPFPGEAEVMVNGAHWDEENMLRLMRDALREECKKSGLILGRAETVRTWVPV